MSESLIEGNDRLAQLLPEIERNVGYAIKNGGVGRVWLQNFYEIKESEARWVVDYFRDKDLEKPTPSFKEGTKYVYDSDTDVYTIENKKGESLEYDGKDVRDIRRKYSNWSGSYDTVKEIAYNYTYLSLRHIKELLFAMDIIHDSSPFTDEEVQEKAKDQLLKELTSLEKTKLAKEWEKTKIKETTAKAKEYDLLVYKQQENRSSLIQELAQHVAPRKLETFKHESDDGLVALVQPADIHLGKLATVSTTGNHYNIEECRRVVLQETDKVLRRVSNLGYPSYIHLVVGHDWLHIDNFAGSTTKGTRQDTDQVSLDIAREGRKLAVEVVELCKQYSPKVVVSGMISNHDLLLGASILDYLEAWYHNDENVLMSVSLRPRQYFKYGDTLIGITHDAKKSGGNGLPLLMAQEASELWGSTKFREIFTGHIHTLKSETVQSAIEYAGVRIWTLPSLSATDQWHELEGYVENVRSIQAHLLSTTEGHIGFFAANVVDELKKIYA